MKIKSIVAAAAITLIAGVGSVSADENDVADTAVNPGTPFALPAGVATPMSEADLDAIRGQGPADQEMAFSIGLIAMYSTTPSSSFGRWELFFDGAAIGH